jgi:hypothetical protein
MNDKQKASILMPLTPAEAQDRVRKLIEYMNPLYDFIFVNKDTNTATTLKDDFDHLTLFIKYESFDREAAVREAYQAGFEAGGEHGQEEN